MAFRWCLVCHFVSIHFILSRSISVSVSVSVASIESACVTLWTGWAYALIWAASYEGYVYIYIYYQNIFQMLKMKHLMVPLEETKGWLLSVNEYVFETYTHTHTLARTTHATPNNNNDNDNNDDNKVRLLTNNRNLSVFLWYHFYLILHLYCIELHTYAPHSCNSSHFKCIAFPSQKFNPKSNCHELQTDWKCQQFTKYTRAQSHTRCLAIKI